MENATRFNTQSTPSWCPGCGNFGIQNAIKKALLSLDLQPHEVAMSSGIGCSGKMPHWVNVYAVHGLHGRTLPVAIGLKLANHKLTVIASGGDGDGYSEGMSHFIHACRRNVDMTYIVHNNGVYGLTTGQVSPTGDKGFASSTTPHGALEWPFEPLALAISAGANFVARGFSGDADHLAGLIAEGIRHRGFSFIDVRQVCVSFNPGKSYKWYQEHIRKIDNDNHDITDKAEALATVFRDDSISLGIFYRGSEPAHEDGIPQLAGGSLVERDIADINIDPLMEKFV